MPIRVFVVDDSDVFLDAVKEVLEAATGFELLGEGHTGEAPPGEAAIPAVRVMKPDLVLVDVLLPGMDGIETCRLLATVDALPFMILCSVDEDPRTSAGVADWSDVPFVPKARISPKALRAAWHSRSGVNSALAHG